MCVGAAETADPFANKPHGRLRRGEIQNLRRKTKLFFFLFREMRVVSPSLCVLDSLGEQQPVPDLTTHLALGPPDNDMVSLLLQNARCACG